MTSHYDYRTRTVVIAPDASLYERLHEEAHRDQHRHPFWAAIMWARWVRGLNYLATLVLEYDALRRARRVMRNLNLWTADVEREAWRCLKTYIYRREGT